MTLEEARKHVEFNVQHNGGAEAQASKSGTNDWRYASRTLISESRGVYLAVDVSRCRFDDARMGELYYSADFDIGMHIVGGDCTDCGCVEGWTTSEVAEKLARVMTKAGL